MNWFVQEAGREWSLYLQMPGFAGQTLHQAWFNPFASNPYGVLLYDQTFKFFFFDPAYADTVKESENLFSSPVVVLASQGTNQAQFI